MCIKTTFSHERLLFTDLSFSLKIVIESNNMWMPKIFQNLDFPPQTSELPVCTILFRYELQSHHLTDTDAQTYNGSWIKHYNKELVQKLLTRPESRLLPLWTRPNEPSPTSSRTWYRSMVTVRGKTTATDVSMAPVNTFLFASCRANKWDNSGLYSKKVSRIAEEA